MPKQIHQRTLFGRPISLEQFKKEICDIISYAPSKLADIAALLGPEWETPESKRSLFYTLKELVRRNSLNKDGRKYILSQTYADIGVSVADTYDRMVLTTIRELGGISTWAELAWTIISPNPIPYRYRPRTRVLYRNKTPMDLAFHRPMEDLMNDAAWSGIRKSLKRLVATGQLTRNYSLAAATGRRRDGIYSLSEEELNRSVLTCRTLEYKVFPFCREKTVREEIKAALDDHARKAGMALWEARYDKGYPIEVVTSNPRVRAAMAYWQRECAIEVGRIQGSRERFNLPVLSREELSVRLYHLMEQFRSLDKSIWPYEKGEDYIRTRRPHMAATAEFFRAVGEVLDVDPVALSRGIVSECVSADPGEKFHLVDPPAEAMDKTLVPW